MKLLMHVAAGNVPVFMEVEGGRQSADKLERGAKNVVSAAQQTLETALERVQIVAASVSNSLQQLTADEVCIEFGVKFSSKADVIIASSNAEATLKITLKWKGASS